MVYTKVTDHHAGTPVGLSAPGSDFEEADISSTDFTPTFGVGRGISWSGDGDIVVVTADKNSDGSGTEKTIPAGYLAPQIIHSIRVAKVIKEGTDATGILIHK